MAACAPTKEEIVNTFTHHDTENFTEYKVGDKIRCVAPDGYKCGAFIIAKITKCTVGCKLCSKKMLYLDGTSANNSWCVKNNDGGYWELMGRREDV